LPWSQFSSRSKHETLLETDKRLERLSEECRFWHMQYDLLRQRCMPYGFIIRSQVTHAPDERAKEQLDTFCRAALALTHHWHEVLEVGYPLEAPFDQWVQGVLLAWHRRCRL